MNKKLVLFLVLAITIVCSPATQAAKQVKVRMSTSLGDIDLVLYAGKAPVTVKNFLSYVDKGEYNGTIFHRVIKGFMIQGGGFDKNLEKRPTRNPIPNEADNGLKNLAGTIAMARTNIPDSATNQFFINTANNGFLDFKEKTVQGWGYTVFGKVIKGMDVVRKIESSPTRYYGPFQNLPATTVVIERVQRLK